MESPALWAIYRRSLAFGTLRIRMRRAFIRRASGLWARCTTRRNISTLRYSALALPRESTSWSKRNSASRVLLFSNESACWIYARTSCIELYAFHGSLRIHNSCRSMIHGVFKENCSRVNMTHPAIYYYFCTWKIINVEWNTNSQFLKIFQRTNGKSHFNLFYRTFNHEYIDHISFFDYYWLY